MVMLTTDESAAALPLKALTRNPSVAPAVSPVKVTEGPRLPREERAFVVGGHASNSVGLYGLPHSDLISSMVCCGAWRWG